MKITFLTNFKVTIFFFFFNPFSFNRFLAQQIYLIWSSIWLYKDGKKISPLHSMVSCVLVYNASCKVIWPHNLVFCIIIIKRKLKSWGGFFKTKKKLINLIKTIRYFTVGFLAERTAYIRRKSSALVLHENVACRAGSAMDDEWCWIPESLQETSTI
jgi:hypothetical protein